MASGHAALLLTERVAWEHFPEYARLLATALRARIGERADAADVRVWQLTIDGEPFYLSYDDYPGWLSLEARTEGASRMVGDIRQRLARLRDNTQAR